MYMYIEISDWDIKSYLFLSEEWYAKTMPFLAPPPPPPPEKKKKKKSEELCSPTVSHIFPQKPTAHLILCILENFNKSFK